MNLGSGVAKWSTDRDHIYLYTIYITPKIWIINRPSFGLFINISAGGITLLSKYGIKNRNLGSNFIFQDYIGIGVKIGKKKALEIALNFHHYSNANIVRPNPGFDVPGVLSIS